MGDINWKDRCWVTTVFLVHDDKVLLTWNKNLQTWIPVGGHIDPGESPEEAVAREVQEETGLDFEFMHIPVHESEGRVKDKIVFFVLGVIFCHDFPCFSFATTFLLLSVALFGSPLLPLRFQHHRDLAQNLAASQMIHQGTDRAA